MPPRSTVPNFRESDLYAPVRDFLAAQGYTVRAEVKHCDVVAVRPRLGDSARHGGSQSAEADQAYGDLAIGDSAHDRPGRARRTDDGQELVVVELKKGLTLALLSQGVKRQREADLVYLAIPRPKKFWFTRTWRDQIHLLRRLELGLILVEVASRSVEVVLEPAEFDRGRSRSSHKKHRAGILKEAKGRSHDGNTGGSTGIKLMTAYREQALRIARRLADGQERSPAQVRDDPSDKKTAVILRNNVYGWFDHCGPGKYRLSEAGGRACADAPLGASDT